MNATNSDFSGKWEIRGTEQLVSQTYTHEEAAELVSRVNSYGAGKLNVQLVESRSVSPGETKRYRALISRSQLPPSAQNILLNEGFSKLQQDAVKYMREGIKEGRVAISAPVIIQKSPAYDFTKWENRNSTQMVSPLLTADEATQVKDKINQANPGCEAFVVASRSGPGHRVVIDKPLSKFEGDVNKLRDLLGNISSEKEKSPEALGSSSPTQMQRSDELERKTDITSIFNQDTPDIRPSPSRFQNSSNLLVRDLISEPSHWGNITRGDSEFLLGNASTGSFLLRDPSSPEEASSEVIKSTKESNNKIFLHEPVELSSTSVEALKNDSNAFLPKPRYDYQLHLNLGSGRSAMGLTNKAQTHSTAIPCSTVDLRSQSPGSEDISKLTHDSRVYIIGHCNQGSESIESDQGKKVSASQFADMIAQNSKLQKEDDGNRIKISVVACYGGKSGLDGQESFASTLSKELAQRGIPAEVLGRTDFVGRASDAAATGAEKFEKRVGATGRHHHEGDKISYFTDSKGNTTSNVVKY